MAAHRLWAGLEGKEPSPPAPGVHAGPPSAGGRLHEVGTIPAQSVIENEELRFDVWLECARTGLCNHSAPGERLDPHREFLPHRLLEGLAHLHHRRGAAR